MNLKASQVTVGHNVKRGSNFDPVLATSEGRSDMMIGAKVVRMTFGSGTVQLLPNYVCEVEEKQFDATAIAREFCAVLNEWLGPDKMKQVVMRNMAEFVNGDMNVCHSHDFCDANEAMDEAFKRATGFSATDTGGDGVGVMTDSACSAFNRAWSLAKAAEFNMAAKAVAS